MEQTREGRLAKNLREVLARLKNILGFMVKVVERCGASLKNSLHKTNPWAGSHCSRVDCVTCNQVGEEMPACTSRSLVYENICVDCNPEALKKGELQNINMEIPSVYVGETARSVQERAKEHWEGFKNVYVGETARSVKKSDLKNINREIPSVCGGDDQVSEERRSQEHHH